MFNYAQEEKEYIKCNACNSNKTYKLSRTSSEGYKVTTCICKNCGLIYINPRMKKEGYDNYYRYSYREDRAKLKGANIKNKDPEVGFQGATKFGKALAQNLKQFINPGLTIDVGSSSGGILNGIKQTIENINPLGIEPSVDASSFANQKGIKTINSLFENIEEENLNAQNILCVQSLNHLLNPRQFIEWSHKHLQIGGHLILAVKDFRFQCRRGGSLKSGIQIDHVYMFTPEVLELIMKASGFKIVHKDIDERKTNKELQKQQESGLHRHHIRLVGEKIYHKKEYNFNIPKNKPNYFKLRFQLFNPFIKFIYYLKYSKKQNF